MVMDMDKKDVEREIIEREKRMKDLEEYSPEWWFHLGVLATLKRFL